ncbi:mechanosensitive ion channel family protein [Frateuria aurantia]
MLEHDIGPLEGLLQSSAYLVALLAIAWLSGRIVLTIGTRIVRSVSSRVRWHFDQFLLEHHVYQWIARLVPGLITGAGLPLIPQLGEHVLELSSRLVSAYMMLCVAMALSSALTALEAMYQARAQGQQRSLKGPLQLIKLAIFLITALLVAGVVSGRQLGMLLSGVGAMSAVLMLIFKDTILGFVAGLQLSANDMLRVGDWITLPTAGADGTVLDISLHTVKIQNFDQTIVTIPTWRLISESYQNWRGMSDSGGRRIKRSLLVDAYSVVEVSPALAAAWAADPQLNGYLHGQVPGLPEVSQPAGWRATNVGLFRVYATAYLKSHPMIHPQMTTLVRQQPNQGTGLPLEVWCFTATTAFEPYEAIQCEIFDHLTAVLPRFGLRLFQQTTGYDTAMAATASLPAEPGPARPVPPLGPTTAWTQL